MRLALSGFAPDGRRFRTEAVLYAAHFRDPAYAKETVLDEMYFGLWKEVGPLVSPEDVRLTETPWRHDVPVRSGA